MTQEVRQSAIHLLRKRQENKLDVMIDGYVGFLSVTRNGRPRTHSEYADVMRKLMAHYNEVSAVKIERCTPHVLRHTFCTKCVATGMDVKSAQYLMGHADAAMTLNIYTDNVMDKVHQSMELLENVAIH
jgi:site-specific recombinase XerD